MILLGSLMAVWVPRPHPLLVAIFERKGKEMGGEMSKQDWIVVVFASREKPTS